MGTQQSMDLLTVYIIGLTKNYLPRKFKANFIVETYVPCKRCPVKGWIQRTTPRRCNQSLCNCCRLTHTDKKEKKIFLRCMEIQMGSGAKSYMRKGFLTWEDMHKYLTIYEEAVSHLWPVFRIHDILVWIRIQGCMPLTNGSRSCYFLLITFWRYSTFTSFFKDKSPKEVTKQLESRFVFLVLLDDRRMMEGSGSASGSIKVCLPIFAWW